jgi:hypothetical protein
VCSVAILWEGTPIKIPLAAGDFAVAHSFHTLLDTTLICSLSVSSRVSDEKAVIPRGEEAK